MKKYLLGLVAVVLAIGFSAFTKSTVTKNKRTDGSYFWYEYDAGADQLGVLVNPNNTVKISKNDAFGYTDCQDETSTDCLRGYDNNDMANESHPPSPLATITQTDESNK